VLNIRDRRLRCAHLPAVHGTSDGRAVDGAVGAPLCAALDRRPNAVAVAVGVADAEAHWRSDGRADRRTISRSDGAAVGVSDGFGRSQRSADAADGAAIRAALGPSVGCADACDRVAERCNGGTVTRADGVA
jgi:hypothetical protein